MADNVPPAVPRALVPLFAGGVLKSTQIDGDTTCWPKGLVPVSILSDTVWADLKAKCSLPEITRESYHCRTLIELEIAKARDDIAQVRRAVPIRKLRDQLGRIARSRLGRKLPTPLLPEVVGLLAGRALDQPFDFASHSQWMERILAQRTVNREIRQWARESIWLGGRWRSWGRSHGGGANYGEQMLIGSLLFLWRERLGRECTNWANTQYRKFVTAPEESAAQLTTFVTECLNLAGARSGDGELITFSMARDRIRRVLIASQSST